ncbi:MAG: hypothetical protein JSU00_14850 [Acidobacteria bacterium]|nr:hypothetical protein [Acidobacteriota bacterium]
MYNKLYFRGPLSSIPQLNAEIESRLPAGWRRCHDEEELYIGLPRHPTCFAHPQMNSTPPGYIILISNDQDEFYVNHIGYTTTRENWDQADFNRVLDAFHEIARPAAEALGFSVELQDRPRRIEGDLSMDAARSLSGFTRSSPKRLLEDQDWTTFILLAHLGNCPLTSERLLLWLCEEQGWPERAAEHLIHRYEDGRQLLALYDEATNRRRR